MQAIHHLFFHHDIIRLTFLSILFLIIFKNLFQNYKNDYKVIFRRDYYSLKTTIPSTIKILHIHIFSPLNDKK